MYVCRSMEISKSIRHSYQTQTCEIFSNVTAVPPIFATNLSNIHRKLVRNSYIITLTS